MEKYFKEIQNILKNTEVTDSTGLAKELEESLIWVAKDVLEIKSKGRQIIFVGNGGSAAVASHKALDFLRSIGVKAISFSDNVNITSMSNDFGYENVFSKQMEVFAEKGDILFAISSSGNSKNILFAVEVARQNGCKVFTFSGFQRNNSLKKLGNLNFYTPASHFNQVEVSHLLLIDYILELVSNL